MKLSPSLPDFFLKNSVKKEKLVKVGLITKYTNLADAYLSVFESCKIAGSELGVDVKVIMINSQSEDLEAQIDAVDAVIVPGGFGKRGMEGKIRAIKHVRETKKPFLGICLGLQLAVVEFARNICGLEAHSSEMFELEDQLDKSSHIIGFMEGQENIKKKGGTMRLGAYECELESGTLAHRLYEVNTTLERHRHRLEVQNSFVPQLEAKGMKVSGKYKLGEGENDYLVEIVELDRELHPYFVAIQSHPELLSRPSKAHPLFRGLIEAI
jgi:CTP synthase